MAEQESLIFDTLDQLLVDKRLKVSMLAGQVCLFYVFACFGAYLTKIMGKCENVHNERLVCGFELLIPTEQGPVLAKLKKELDKFWRGEACKGRTIEECARFDSLCGIDIFVESYHFQGLGAP